FMSIGFAAFVVFMENKHQKTITVNDYCSNEMFKNQVAYWVGQIKEQGMNKILMS
ncbi:MAG: hypothetical protein RLZZ196_2321, partial [Bacteroidota bacterium]